MKHISVELDNSNRLDSPLENVSKRHEPASNSWIWDVPSFEQELEHFDNCNKIEMLTYPHDYEAPDVVHFIDETGDVFWVGALLLSSLLALILVVVLVICGVPFVTALVLQSAVGTGVFATLVILRYL